MAAVSPARSRGPTSRARAGGGRWQLLPQAPERHRDDRELLFEAVLDFHSDLENFYYLFTRRVFENGELLREKSWDETIPREFH